MLLKSRLVTTLSVLVVIFFLQWAGVVALPIYRDCEPCGAACADTVGVMAVMTKNTPK